jgi:hypothetical protein
MITIAFAVARVFAPPSRNSSQLLLRARVKNGPSPFTRFGIQLYYGPLTTVVLRHRQLHDAVMIKSADAFFVGRCAGCVKEGARGCREGEGVRADGCGAEHALIDRRQAGAMNCPTLPKGFQMIYSEAQLRLAAPQAAQE